MGHKLNQISFLNQSEATRIDQELFSEYGFSVDQLMELAGLACAVSIRRSYENELRKNENVLVICGPGNNGGDGLVCARHLAMYGCKPSILYPKKPSGEKDPTGLFGRLVKQMDGMGIPFVDNLPNNLSDFGVIIDAMFGFSFRPPLRQPFDSILRNLSECRNVPIASIDIPSGWDVEKGPLPDLPDIQPDFLISLTAPKLCSQRFSGRYHWIGGRFVPPLLQSKHNLLLPSYAGDEFVFKLD